LFACLFAVLGIKFRASHILAKCSITELYLQPYSESLEASSMEPFVESEPGKHSLTRAATMLLLVHCSEVLRSQIRLWYCTH
jgi:hypothetical protein